MLIKCEDCGKEYSVTLKNCPQCGRKRPFKKKCLTCGRETEVITHLCKYCGFPHYENHNIVTIDSDELLKQEELIQALVQEVEQKKEEFKDALFAYKESYLKDWQGEIEDQMQGVRDQIEALEYEKKAVGIFGFAQKGKIGKEIEQLQQILKVYQETKGPFYENHVRVMNGIFTDQTKEQGHYWLTSGRLNYFSSLEASLIRNINHLRRHNSQYTVRCAMIKDIALDIIAKHGKPILETDLIQSIKKQDSSLCDIVPLVFIECFNDLLKEGRIIQQSGRKCANSDSDLEKYYRLRTDFSVVPPNPVSVFDKKDELNRAKQVIGELKEKYGSNYNEYMNNLAASIGFDVFRNAAIVFLEDSLRKEAVAAMGAIINASAAVQYSKKTDAALAGGLAAGLTTPMVGAYVHYKVTQSNRYKDELRKQAEIDRDSWMREYKLSAVNKEMTNLDRFDFELYTYIMNQA